MANETNNGTQYTSWIRLVDRAEQTISALKQRTNLITIGDKDDVTENCVIIFDTSMFSE